MANVYEIHSAVQHFDGRGCEFVVVARDDEDSSIPAHGETVYCKEDHQHSKACAVSLMKARPVVGKDAAGKDVLGKSPMEVCETYIRGFKGKKAPEEISMPTKKVKNGKDEEIEVPDKGISLA